MRSGSHDYDWGYPLFVVVWQAAQAQHRPHRMFGYQVCGLCVCHNNCEE